MNGKITNRDFEVAFDFKAIKGEVFIIEMKAVDALELTSPQIIILDSNGDVVADASSNIGFGGLTPV